MKAINLFTFTRIQQDYATEYENLLSRRVKKEKVRAYEFETLVNLVEMLLGNGVEIAVLEGFFYSFKIEQISKEFDLLKIEQNHMVLNIELKSEPIEEEALKKQLEQNKYYLKHLADDIRLFTFIGETKEIYQYVDGDVVKVPIGALIEAMQLFSTSILEGIEGLFDANKFLISPLNTPEEFLKGQYFLTGQQEEIKKAILRIVNEGVGTPCLFGITGKAGTGKTLLLYDLVRTISGRGNGCCVIHSGILCEGHDYLNKNWNNVDILAAKELNGDGHKLLEKYDFIFVDESQRIYKSAVDKIVNEVSQKGKTAMFSYDFVQSLSYTEEKRNIPDVLSQINGFREYSLSEKIRTSKELASFYKTLLNLKNASKGYMDYSNIEVLYANLNVEQMIKVLKEFTATAAEKLGKIEISNEKERFCFFGILSCIFRIRCYTELVLPILGGDSF